MQLKTLFANTVQRFRQADIPDPELEVSLLLAHVLKMERTAVLLAGEKTLSIHECERFAEGRARRLSREPLAYIIGEKEFWSLPFRVTRDVLIPRPETEFLLEKTLAMVKRSMQNRGHSIRVLDAGTGSGVIAVILARELAMAKITAVDYSYRALKVARHNAKKHGVAERIDFVNCQWFDAMTPGPRFDVVVSNPPYVAREILERPRGRTMGALQPEVWDFEPRLALDGGERGVREIKKIAAGLEKVLSPGGWFFMEIGADQEREVLDIFKSTAAFGNTEVYADYAGRPRVFQARKI